MWRGGEEIEAFLLFLPQPSSAAEERTRSSFEGLHICFQIAAGLRHCTTSCALLPSESR